MIPGRFPANRSIAARPGAGRPRRQRLPGRRGPPAGRRAAARSTSSTGARNPLTIDGSGRDRHATTSASARSPGEDGLPVDVPDWRFSSRAAASLTALDRSATVLETGRELVDRVPLPRVDDVELRLHKDQRRLDRLRRLTEIYGPYGELDCVFDDRNSARAARRASHPEDRERFDFDVDEIDWEHYLARRPPPGAARDRRAAAAAARSRARAGRRPSSRGPARAGDLRRRGRRARLDRRALLRLAAHARHARARPAGLERRRRRARAGRGCR